MKATLFTILDCAWASGQASKRFDDFTLKRALDEQMVRQILDRLAFRVCEKNRKTVT